MKFEIILKTKAHPNASYEVKRCGVFPELRYASALKAFDEYAATLHEQFVILVNQLDDDGVFVETII